MRRPFRHQDTRTAGYHVDVLDLAAAREAWPDVDIGDDEVLAYLEARGVDVATACVADLYLACAIAAGNPAALHAFDRVLDAECPSAIAHLDGGTALLSDVIHAVRARVLGAGAPGKILDYRGRGNLRGWLRVVAVREALQLQRQRRREAPMPEDQDIAAHLDGAGAATMTEREREIHREAFRGALASLTPRDRNLLRQHYLHGATIDELGVLHGVHRATAARWIADLRELLLDRTRRHIAAVLRLSGGELESEMRRVAAHLEITLQHTLSFER
jgi:RNA polymerase sigma-70 factor (ECF subfamily)